LGPAYASGLEKVQGRLAPGFYADLLILDENPFTTASSKLPNLLPEATMVGGEWVWKG
jgi:predicted amidohydrolase YtcJ